MKLRLSDNLLVLMAMAAALLAAVFAILLPDSPVTFVFAVLLTFFLPGYALTRAFFRDQLKFDLFMLMSIGLSLITTMLIALFLAMTPIRLTLASALGCLVGLVVVALAIEKIKHRENRKYEVEITRPKKEDFDPIVTIALAFGVVLILIFSYVIVTVKPPSDTHVILLSENLDTDLPENVTVGETVNFTVRIYNGEPGVTAQFHLILNMTNITGAGGYGYVYDMNEHETHDFTFGFIPLVAGRQMAKVDVEIAGAYYGNVHFWLNVA